MPIIKYLHCRQCWGVIGEIPATQPRTEFDTFDCGWQCKCGRYNLSSDGIIERHDIDRNLHLFYARSDKEQELVNRLEESFEFNKNKFKPQIN